jgi:hypothetical protein
MTRPEYILACRTTRCSFDSVCGIIYQTALVAYQVKGDEQGRTVTIPALAAIHKRAGDEKITGLEVYGDATPMKEIVKEVMSSRG